MELPFDLYVESEERKALIEVKGVTLEENDIVRFRTRLQSVGSSISTN